MMLGALVWALDLSFGEGFVIGALAIVVMGLLLFHDDEKHNNRKH